MKIRLSVEGSPDGVRTPASFLQSSFWASFKTSHGWDHRDFILSEYSDTPDEVRLSVLFRRFRAFFTVAYVPMGPDVDCADPARQGRLLTELADALRSFLPRNTIMIRFDPPWGTSSHPDAPSVFPPSPACRRAPVQVQPPDTVVLDLEPPAERLLESMKPKWRYNVKLSEKKGVVIRRLEGPDAADAGLEIFWDLYLTTAKRDGIALHSKAYYADLLRKAGEDRDLASGGRPLFSLYIAEYGNKALAAIIVLRYGKEAVYLYGASSNEYRNLMSAYALQWRAILDAKEAGCTRYDFYGIPPNDDPSHPMHGLYRFKTGFGGNVVHRVGSLDVPLRPVVYLPYAFAERARAFWFKRVKKMFRKDTRGTS